MNTFALSFKKRIHLFFHEYGKVAVVIILTVLVFSCFVFIFKLYSSKELEISFLDVGQGDAILITTPSGKQMLIDGGATNKVLEELEDHISYFDRTLDVMVATHPDSDHVTGLIPVLEKYTINNVVTSNVTGETGIFKELTKRINEENANFYIGRKGDVIDFGDGVKAYVLYPKDRVAKDTNDGSVSMVIKYGEHSFLLTGDLSSSFEQELLQPSLFKNVTIYKAGHHGSRTSSGEVLLAYTQPEYVVISAGKDNDYGHPHKESLERFSKYAKETLSTVDRGAITFISDGNLLQIKTKR